MAAYFLSTLPLTLAAAEPCPFSIFLQPAIHCGTRVSASLTLVPAGYIGPGDAAPGGNFPLGQRVLAAQAVAQPDDHGLPLIQAVLHALAYPDAGLPGIQIVQHVVVHTDDVHQGEGAPVPVRLQRVRQGHLPLELFPAAEVHQNFIFNTPAGIGGKAHVLVRPEGGDALDEPDGADGDQVVLVVGLGVVFLKGLLQETNPPR